MKSNNKLMTPNVFLSESLMLILRSRKPEINTQDYLFCYVL